MKDLGEGAAFQMIISPPQESIHKEFRYALDKMRRGEKLKDAYAPGIGKAMLKVGKELIFGVKKPEDENPDKKVDQSFYIENITKKLDSMIMQASFRLITSAGTKDRAEALLMSLESTFNQFDDPDGNGFLFERVRDRDMQEFLYNFSYRIPDENKALPLNLHELGVVFHFPIGVTSTPQLKEAKSGQAPAPYTETGESSVLLGINNYRGAENKVYFGKDDRVRHMYVIGQTGTGKTNILKNMIIQDIQNGDGCCFIDPHGSDIQDILANVPPERADDVIYFDPASISRPMGLNMLEYDINHPEQKTFVVDEMISIFNKLFDMKATGGPMFEQYFRNATMLALEDPESGSTLLDISRVLSDEEFRNMKLSKSKNPVVNQFWQKVAGKAGGEASLANIVPYITSKFDVFLSNEIMRPIIAQEKSAFKMREVMDQKKILLVNLSKGRLGEINAGLIGLIIVGKILMAALSRVDSYGQKLNDFYLYIDEFQNITTNSISQILSEARKYRLSLNLANQYISQIEETIRNAVFGNVGSMAVFRVDASDAEFLKNRFEPTVTEQDIIKLDNFNCYVRLLVKGVPVKPFNIRTLKASEGRPEIADQLKELSSLKFGRPREEVEAEVAKRYASM